MEYPIKILVPGKKYPNRGGKVNGEFDETVDRERGGWLRGCKEDRWIY